jgi:hypothetical protein
VPAARAVGDRLSRATHPADLPGSSTARPLAGPWPAAAPLRYAQQAPRACAVSFRVIRRALGACGRPCASTSSTARVRPHTEPLVQARAEPAPRTHAEPLAQAWAEPAPRPHTEPLVQARAEPAPRTHTEPLAQARAEPAPRPHTEPLVQARAEPAPRPHTEPLAQARAEPAPRPHTEPLVQARAEPAPRPLRGQRMFRRETAGRPRSGRRHAGAGRSEHSPARRPSSRGGARLAAPRRRLDMHTRAAGERPAEEARVCGRG